MKGFYEDYEAQSDFKMSTSFGPNPKPLQGLISCWAMASLLTSLGTVFFWEDEDDLLCLLR